MPLVSIKQELIKATKEGYALPLFDTFEMMGTEGIFDALEEKQAPAMVAVGGNVFERSHGKAFVGYIKQRAQDSSLPVSLMLDHGHSFEHCMKAISLGFTDVMYDGSELPIEENIANTKAIVRVAHSIGIGVEAELGHVGRGDEYGDFGSQRKGFTNPDAVERFVAETDVDFLAVAFGSAHGLYKGEPELDIELLGRIRERVDIPLVMHGGSGLRDDQYRAAIEAGIAKINIFTNLAVAGTDKMLKVAESEDASCFGMTNALRQGFAEGCKHCLDVFGATGKAK